MFLVLTADNHILYLGDNHTYTLEVLGHTATNKLHVVENLEDLRAVLGFADYEKTAPNVKLKEFTNNVCDGTKKVFGEVKSLGVRGLEKISKGYIALGEAIKKMREEAETEVEEEDKADEKKVD